MGTLTDPLSIAWIDWATAERKPVNTVERRRVVLTQVGNAGTATREEIEAWWSTRRDMSDATRANELACLRAFYKWLARWDHRTDDPTRRLDPPKLENPVPQPFSRAQVRQLLDATQDRPDLRRAIALGAYAGLRISEAAALHWRNINLETRRIRVELSKGKKTRLVGLSPLLFDEIAPEVDGNVVTGGAAYSAAVLQRKINRAIRAAGVDGTFHQLRARYATVAVGETGDLLAVSRALGHSSLNTIKHYVQISDETLDVIALAASR